MESIVNFKTKVERLFLKNGGDGSRIKIFTHLSKREQEILLRMICLTPSELPVIGGCDGEYCLLLTDQRLVEVDRGKQRLAVLSKVTEVKVDVTEAKRRPAGDWSRLDLIEEPNNLVSFKLENGGPLFGLWNVLLFVVAHNRPRRTGSVTR